MSCDILKIYITNEQKKCIFDLLNFTKKVDSTYGGKSESYQFYKVTENLVTIPFSFYRKIFENEPKGL